MTNRRNGRRQVIGMAFCLPLGACLQSVNQPTPQVVAAQRRDLTPAEKAAIAPMIARTMKDPDSAKLQWMPVALTERDHITDYCGLVNGKNSYGGYTGFTRFYAQLKKDEKGQFTSADMRAMEEPNREKNPLDPRWMNGICETFGYESFNLAKP